MILKEKQFREHQSGLLVSQDGEVFVSKTKGHFEHFTYGSVNGRGYKQVRHNRKLYYVHRLVAECYLENPYGKPCVDHINMDKSDNRVENLRWCTAKENHSFEDQDVHKRIGEKQTNRTDQSKQVIQLTLDDVEVARFPSTREVERQLNLAPSNISACCNGKRKTAYKSKWRYA